MICWVQPSCTGETVRWMADVNRVYLYHHFDSGHFTAAIVTAAFIRLSRFYEHILLAMERRVYL